VAKRKPGGGDVGGGVGGRLRSESGRWGWEQGTEWGMKCEQEGGQSRKGGRGNGGGWG